jgi:hypothetical protein
VLIAGDRDNDYVRPECWKPSLALRIVTLARGLIFGVLGYILFRYLFPQFLLLTYLGIAGLALVSFCFMPLRVALNRADGEVAIGAAFWTKHVPLTQIKRVKQAHRLGIKISTAEGWSIRFGLPKKRPWLRRLLKIRTGFEGMERTITRAVAAARAADPDRAAADYAAAARKGFQVGLPGSFLVCAGGLFELVLAATVRPQTAGWIVHDAAVLLRIYFGAVGVLCVLFGAWLVVGAWRIRHAMPRGPDLSDAYG